MLNLSDVRVETAVKLPFAADCCPCVEKLRTVLPLTHTLPSNPPNATSGAITI
jgi:hypothetical protein